MLSAKGLATNCVQRILSSKTMLAVTVEIPAAVSFAGSGGSATSNCFWKLLGWWLLEAAGYTPANRRQHSSINVSSASKQ